MPKRDLKRVMAIEDEPDIREIILLSLEAVGGFTVKTCASGEDGVAAASSFRPDLLLLDVMMPGLDGPSTLGRLRGLDGLAKTPIVFMTAKAQRHEIERFLSLGAADVIAKPFDPMTLADKLREIWLRIPD